MCFGNWIEMRAICFFFSSRRRHTRCSRDWSSDVCSSDLRRPDHAGDPQRGPEAALRDRRRGARPRPARSEEHTSELQSRLHLVCRLLLEKKKKKILSPSATTLTTHTDLSLHFQCSESAHI